MKLVRNTTVKLGLIDQSILLSENPYNVFYYFSQLIINGCTFTLEQAAQILVGRGGIVDPRIITFL